MLLGHFGRGALVAVNAANAARAVPTLALLTLFAIVPSISLTWGGFLASFLALVILAVPPILTNTYVGMREVDADVREAAAGMGLSARQIMFGVELPLAVPFVATGVRVAAIEVVATSTLAAYVSFSDLGTYVIAGLDDGRASVRRKSSRAVPHCRSTTKPASASSLAIPSRVNFALTSVRTSSPCSKSRVTPRSAIWTLCLALERRRISIHCAPRSQRTTCSKRSGSKSA